MAKVFSVSISPSNEYPGLISFRMDWLDLLAVHRTLKILLQHNSPKASILRHSAFYIVPLSHPYMTTGKTIALTRWTFFGKANSKQVSLRVEAPFLCSAPTFRIDIIAQMWHAENTGAHLPCPILCDGFMPGETSQSGYRLLPAHSSDHSAPREEV